MNLALQKYHKIYFPQPDIYERGGNFFKHFARKIKEGEKDQRPNLVIIPQSYERLLRTKEYQLRGGQRIEEALKAMDSLNGQNGDHVSIGKTKQKTNASIFSYDSDLHIAIVEDRTDGRLSEIIEILNPVVSEDYLQSIDKRQFTIVTNQHGIRSQFPRTNVHIEPPKFMMYSTAILDE
ncbi:MAG TPA: hypothetical protein VK158_02320, partial [Acidobacteriota bacterium]|nr:hypothetical protein [Acidobacteriota bacterium]